MPARSKAQQKAAGAALSAKRGDTSKKKLVGASRDMFESMDEQELRELAATRHRDKPEHVSDESADKPPDRHRDKAAGKKQDKSTDNTPK